MNATPHLNALKDFYLYEPIMTFPERDVVLYCKFSPVESVAVYQVYQYKQQIGEFTNLEEAIAFYLEF